MGESSEKKIKFPQNVVSLFAGIGGFELGFKKAGFETILSCEIDPIAQHVLHANFPEVPIVDDIRNLKRIPKDTTIICAGFPCQDISTIGIKTGLSGERSSLVNEVFRLLRRKKVEWVIFENVSNMLHLKNGEVIKTITDGLDSLGYRWAYRMINSISFLPQHRKRVYVVASLHHNPCDVLLSGSSSIKYGLITSEEFKEPCGFYWTEGKYAIGLFQNAIPTLKVGSTIGIASPPAIAFPNGVVGTPDIRDAERLQGFPSNWTQPAEEVAKASSRWKLVGNAVTVDVIEWIAKKILSPEVYDTKKDKEMIAIKRWPNAAWGCRGKVYASIVSENPIVRKEISISKFLEHPCKPLSYKAAKGFENRLESGTVRCPLFFSKAIHDYVEERGQ